jgi:hypothetical protein
MGRPPKRVAEEPLRLKLERRIRDLEDENVMLQKQLDRQKQRYAKLIDRTIELVFGDLKND